MEIVPLVIVPIAIIALGWYLTRPRVFFVLKYKNGQARVVRGELKENRLMAIDDICRQNGVVSGTISAVPAGKGFRLKFSNDISQGCQQQIRNLLLSGAFKDLRLAPPR
jgi:hypothetical protein